MNAKKVSVKKWTISSPDKFNVTKIRDTLGEYCVTKEIAKSRLAEQFTQNYESLINGDDSAKMSIAKNAICGIKNFDQQLDVLKKNGFVLNEIFSPDEVVAKLVIMFSDNLSKLALLINNLGGNVVAPVNTQSGESIKDPTKSSLKPLSKKPKARVKVGKPKAVKPKEKELIKKNKACFLSYDSEVQKYEKLFTGLFTDKIKQSNVLTLLQKHTTELSKLDQKLKIDEYLKNLLKTQKSRGFVYQWCEKNRKVKFSIKNEPEKIAANILYVNGSQLDKLKEIYDILSNLSNLEVNETQQESRKRKYVEVLSSSGESPEKRLNTNFSSLEETFDLEGFYPTISEFDLVDLEKIISVGEDSGFPEEGGFEKVDSFLNF